MAGCTVNLASLHFASFRLPDDDQRGDNISKLARRSNGNFFRNGLEKFADFFLLLVFFLGTCAPPR